jgi:hypothetical protein
LACRGPTLERTIFFARPPAIEADVIVNVTITKIVEGAPQSVFTAPGDRTVSFEGWARINRVVRGSVSEQVIKIRAPATSCDHPFSVGMSGFVAGTLRQDSAGATELLAVSSTQGR